MQLLENDESDRHNSGEGREMIEGYKAGVNLGGWISQYGEKGIEHFMNFIQEKDIERIASWGMDHIRLPVDYPVLEDDNKPFKYKEEGFAYIDKGLTWCRKYSLNIVLDIHKAPGYSFSSLNTNTLFDDMGMRKRFLELWKTIAQRYKGEGDNLIFELLNEIVEPDSSRWNKLAHETIQIIKKIDSNRKIIYGGNYYNSVRELKNIDILDDPEVIYTFHFYHPHLFTHQKASWSKMAVDYNQIIEYPGKFVNLDRFEREYPEYKSWIDKNRGVNINKKMLLEDMKPAVDFINKTGQELYCGEFGVIERAPLESRINWYRDFIEVLNKLKIGWSIWTYKGMDFGLVNAQGEIVSEELIEVIKYSLQWYSGVDEV